MGVDDRMRDPDRVTNLFRIHAGLCPMTALIIHFDAERWFGLLPAPINFPKDFRS
jgi:hypothetical protein